MDKGLVLGITGASGSIYAFRFLEHAIRLKLKVECIVSETAERVISYELDKPFEEFKSYFSSKGVRFHSPENFFAPLASGSYLKEKFKGVVILPCSVGTLGAVANGIVSNLIHRVCDVSIKENIPLILAVREMPLNAIHLENMLKLQKIGVKAFPISPGFYGKPSTIEDLVDFAVGKILDLLEVNHQIYKRWGL